MQASPRNSSLSSLKVSIDGFKLATPLIQDEPVQPLRSAFPIFEFQAHLKKMKNQIPRVSQTNRVQVMTYPNANPNGRP